MEAQRFRANLSILAVAGLVSVLYLLVVSGRLCSTNVLRSASPPTLRAEPAGGPPPQQQPSGSTCAWFHRAIPCFVVYQGFATLDSPVQHANGPHSSSAQYS